MILQRVQLVISAVLRQKLLMVPLLEDLAVGQHNNVVRVLDGGQPVASSRIITLGLWMIVRAKLNSWRCPAEKLFPRSRTSSSRPWSSLSMNLSALT